MGTVSSRRSAGLLFGICSSLSFGLSGTLARGMTDGGFGPLQTVWMRMLGASVVLVGAMLLLRRGGVFKAVLRDRTARRGVFLFGLVAVAFCQALSFIAFARLPVGIAILVEYIGPVLVVLHTRFVRRIHLPPVAFVGIGLAIVGLCCVVEVWSGLRFDALGLVCAAGSAIGNAAYFVIPDGLTGAVDPLTLTTGGMVVGCVLLLPIAMPWSAPWHLLGAPIALPHFSAPGWAVAVALILISTVVAYVAGGMAVQRLSASVAAALAYIEPISSTLFAWLVLAQKLGSMQLFGGVVVLFGAYLAQNAASRTAVVPGAVPVAVPVAVAVPEYGVDRAAIRADVDQAAVDRADAAAVVTDAHGAAPVSHGAAPVSAG